MNDYWQRQAEYLVEANRERFPGVLVEQMASAMRSESRALGTAEFSRECAIVALRMLKRAGKLKPTTDDERAAVELAGTRVETPAANRRLIGFDPEHPPSRDEYVASAVEVGQQVLFARLG